MQMLRLCNCTYIITHIDLLLKIKFDRTILKKTVAKKQEIHEKKCYYQ